MKDPFVHLHVHSTYSPLDGMIRIPELVAKIKKLGQRGVAVTDHGNLAAAPQLYMEAKRLDILPFIGQEFYIVPDATVRTGRDNHHIVLLALDERGYRLLVELSSIANLKENYYYSPRIDWNILKHYRKDMKHIAALTACMSGEVQSAFGDKERLNAVIRNYKDTFPNLFVELQLHPDHGDNPDDLAFSDRERSNYRTLVRLADRFALPMVITNDSHYLDKGDQFAHEVMLAIQTRAKLQDPGRFRFNASGFHISSGRALQKRFDSSDWRKSLDSIDHLVSSVNIHIPEFEKRTFHMPRYRKNAISLVRDLCEEKLLEGNYPEEYWERYKYEIAIIEEANFADEMLIVRDYVQWARDNEIEVGPGRGSMVGVLVSYLLGITHVDPIRYNLSFERAINPARPSLPDFDVDFQDDRRKEVFEYLRQRWGQENVIQVGTYGTLQPRGIIGSIMKSLGYSFQEEKEVTKSLPSMVEISNLKRKATIQDLLEGEEVSPQLQKLLDEHPWVADVAIKLQGIISGQGSHAAGIVISDKRKPIRQYVPKMLIASSGVEASQYDMYSLGKLGFIKFDVLGLKTLSVIAQAKKFIGSDPFAGVDYLNDKATLEMLDKGDLLTIFELQGAASQQAVRALGVRDFNDVIALQALSRAGANQFIPEYREGRDGSKAWKKRLAKIHPALVDILGYTYGAVVYQEQVMEIGRRVAGFDWTMVDKTKDAIKHKSSREFEELREPFYAGSRANGVTLEGTDTVWKMIERYCGYGFNLSHATAYATICQQTAYLKCHYPREWFAAYLNLCSFDEYGPILENARARGVTIYPPDINKSGEKCYPYRDGILFGLSLIKGVGSKVSDAIVQSSPYASIDELKEKVQKRYLNSRVLRILDETGTLRNIGGSGKPSREVEQQYLGGYVYSHPLDKYRVLIEEIYSNPENSASLQDGSGSAIIAGMVSKVREITTKNGDKMGFVTITFYDRSFECVVFPRQWDRKAFKVGKVMALQGKMQPERGSFIAEYYTGLSIKDGQLEFAE